MEALLTMMRLDKYLAEMGIGTRQEVKKKIRQGNISVNGTVVKAADTKIDENQDLLIPLNRFFYDKT